MRPKSLLFAVTLTTASCAARVQESESLPKPAAAPLRPVTAIELPKVEGRIDHLALDAKRMRLYVAALGNGSLEVVDLKAGKSLRSIGGLEEPQGMLFLPDLDRAVVANGGSGMLDVYDGESLERSAHVEVGEDADNLRYDAKKGLVYVGWGDGALAIVDAKEWKVLGNIALGGHPESFQLDPSGARAWVNVPDRRSILVVDLEQRKAVATWPVESAQANFPMAYSAADHLLFVGCRKPARLLVFDVSTGKQAAELELSGDADDVFVDPASQRVYASCGEGFLDVFDRVAANRYVRSPLTETASGARTSLFVPELKRLYLAVPHRGEQRAEIRVYGV